MKPKDQCVCVSACAWEEREKIRKNNEIQNIRDASRWKRIRKSDACAKKKVPKTWKSVQALLSVSQYHTGTLTNNFARVNLLLGKTVPWFDILLISSNFCESLFELVEFAQ